MKEIISEFRVSERSVHFHSQRKCNSNCKCGNCYFSLNRQDQNSVEIEIYVHTNAPNSFNQLKFDEKSFNVILKPNTEETQMDFIISRIYGLECCNDISYRVILAKHGFDSAKIDRFIDFINHYALDFICQISDDTGDIYSFRKKIKRKLECLKDEERERPF